MNARDVELRDGPATPRPPQWTMSVDVMSGEFILGAIDVVLDEGSRSLDDWDRQMIESARELAALVLIIDRAQRGGGLAVVHADAGVDGAAPIVGSSAAIRAVRSRIERVAATGFTVLIEGGIDSQAHPSSIEVFARVAVGEGDREVERAGHAQAVLTTCA